MKILDNIHDTVRDDLAAVIKKGSKVSIAAACFSMYAFEKLKKQLEQVDEFRFIFTSPTFIKERAEKQKREFYIPRISRESSLYGTEFEIKLRNEMTQRAIAERMRPMDQQQGNVQIQHNRREYGRFYDRCLENRANGLYAAQRFHHS